MLTPPFQRFRRYTIPTHENPETHGSLSEKIWVVLFQDENNEPSIQFLEKILKAVRVDLKKETCQIYVDNRGTILKKLIPDLNARIIISFGPSPKNMGMNLSDRFYHPLDLDVNTYLFSETLSTIANNQNSKKHLWNSLQELFKTN